MTLDKTKITAICFDIDGTLRNTDDQYVEKLKKILSPILFFLNQKRISSLARWIIMFAETPGNILMSIPDRLGFDDKLIKLNNKKQKNDEPMIMVPGALEAIKILSAKYKLAIVSARRKSKVDHFVHTNNLGMHFPVVISALSAKRNKPHPAPVLLAAEKIGVKPENILMVGDTTYDILTGKRAGAQTAAVVSGFGEKKELQRVGADIILESVTDLPELLGFVVKFVCNCHNQKDTL